MVNWFAGQIIFGGHLPGFCGDLGRDRAGREFGVEATRCDPKL